MDDQFDPSAGLDQAVEVMVVQSDGHILLGGAFTTVNGVARSYLARLHGDDATPRAPVIAIQPQSQNAAEGGPVILSVSAEGPGLRYQWQFKDTPIAGANEARLVLTKLTGAASGSYTVVVSNELGTLKSEPAVLKVQLLGEVLNTPDLAWKSQLNYGDDIIAEAGWSYETNVTHDGIAAARFNCGSHASISGIVERGAGVLATTVMGPGSLTFWYKGPGIRCNFESNPGAPLVTSDWREVKTEIPDGLQNLAWWAVPESTPAYLDAVSFARSGLPAARIVARSGDQTVLEGADVVLSLTVIGTPPFEYQWSFNGTDLPAATNGTLTLSNLRGFDSGAYEARVSNAVGADSSGPIQIRVQFPYLRSSENGGRVTMAFSPDGQTFASGVIQVSQGVSLGGIVTAAPLTGYPTRQRIIVGVTFSLDSAFLAVADREGISEWRVGSPSPLRSVPVPVTVALFNLAYTPDRKLLGLGTNSNGQLFLWQDVAGGRLSMLGSRTGPKRAVFSPHRDLAASGSPVDAQVYLWRAPEGTVVRALDGPGAAKALAFAPGGGMLAVGGTSNKVRLWHVSDGAVLRDLVLPYRDSNATVLALAFTPEGSALAAEYSDGRLAFWRVSDGVLLRCNPMGLIKGNLDSIEAIAFSSDGQFLAFTTGGGLLVVARNPLVSPASVRLVVGGGSTQSGFAFLLLGQRGTQYQIERSADLKQWLLWRMVTNLDGAVELTDPDTTNRGQSYYRAVVR